MPDTVLTANPLSPKDLKATLPTDFTNFSNRSHVVLLQTLVSIVLSYQLLFSSGTALDREGQEFIILGLMILVVLLMMVPLRMLEAGWFTGALVLGDTALTTGVIYVSSKAVSNLDLVYFLIILIAASTRTLKQMFAISVILCAAYGVVLYMEAGESAVVLEDHLIRIPLLLVMAIFYGVTTERVRRVSREKADLIDYIVEGKRVEEEREKLIRQLQDALASIKTLSGLLPICANCKKIRDDKGYWHSVETYVSQHSEVDFTHGICPVCVDKLYGDLKQGERGG